MAGGSPRPGAIVVPRLSELGRNKLVAGKIDVNLQTADELASHLTCPLNECIEDTVRLATTQGVRQASDRPTRPVSIGILRCLPGDRAKSM